MLPFTDAAQLRILHLEDDLLDAALVLSTLQDGGVPCQALRVDTHADYAQALDEGGFDLILSDLTLPGFDGRTALKLARRRRPDIPFIFVSGTMGEEAAIEGLVNGATDYVLKHRYSRLVPAVQRAMLETQERRRRVEAEAQLASAYHQLRNLFEHLDDVFLSIDMIQPQRSQISPACERIFGWTPSQFLEHPQLLLDCVLEEDKGTLPSVLVELQRERPVRSECRILNRDGIQRHLEFQLKPVFNDHNILIRIDGAVRDVTDQRTMERQLLRSQRLESIGTLASGIAHDLNNVLTPILASVQVLRDRTDDPRSEDMLSTLALSAQRGAELIRQVLTFARGIEEQRGPVRLAHVFADVVRILGETLPRSIYTCTDVPRNLWSVRGDPTQLRQLLLNLCVNARDAMPGGGELVIVARNTIVRHQRRSGGLELEPGFYVLLEVRDTGTGIPPETIAQIFEPFFTTKPDGRGTGLGLYTVKAIVRSHGGFIDIATKEGHGATFGVYLPADANRASEHTEEPQEDLPMGDGELVLLVDDEAAVRDIVGTTLEAYGYRVITASNGVEGLDIFQTRGPEIDFVLSDMNMPAMNGDVMIREIRKLDANVRIVAASGLSPEYGGTATPVTDPRLARLHKPFSTRELLNTMKALAVLAE